jgi:HAD superfamily hydrolase (TIGR01509 family)
MTSTNAIPGQPPAFARADRTIRAGIFDMDGVLLDSEPLHHRAINELLQEEGVAPLSMIEYSRYLGTTDAYTWGDLVARRRLRHAPGHYLDRFDGAITDLYERYSAPAPGSVELLELLQAAGVPLAVASSSRRTWIETCLARLGVRRFFQAVVSGDMVRRGKPDPEIYLLAAQQLSVSPEQCFAIEDSPQGITAAITAGMFTVAVDSTYAHALRAATPHLHVRSLAELVDLDLFSF